MLHRRFIRRATLLAATLVLAAPALASADGAPLFTIGPVAVKHGYSVSAAGEGCGTPYTVGSISFGKTTRRWSQTHSYSATGGHKAQCHVSRDLSSGSMTFALGRMATVDITFRKHGRIRKAPLPPGCTGPKPATAYGTATGTFTVKLLARFFGKVRLHSVKASITRLAYTCRPTRAQKRTISLSASRGTEGSGLSLGASRPPGGPSLVTIEQYGPFSRTIAATHFLTLTGGTSLFKARSNLDTARVAGSARPLRGRLKFTADPNCKGNVRTGTLAGSLRINFDTLPTQGLRAAPTTYQGISKGQGGVPCSG
ncbi:MAG: hypothetical protein ACJ764_08740 [Solirubrobacteraceae bacterium]